MNLEYLGLCLRLSKKCQRICYSFLEVALILVMLLEKVSPHCMNHFHKSASYRRVWNCV